MSFYVIWTADTTASNSLTEFEQDNEFPFLDILVKRCPDKTFVTSI